MAGTAAAVFLKIKNLTDPEARSLGREAVRAFGRARAVAFAEHCLAETLSAEREVHTPKSWIGNAINTRCETPHGRKRKGPAPADLSLDRAVADRRAEILEAVRRIAKAGDHVRLRGKRRVWTVESGDAMPAFYTDHSGAMFYVPGGLLGIVESAIAPVCPDVAKAVAEALEIVEPVEAGS